MNFYLGGPLFIVFFLALGVALWLDTEPFNDGDESDDGEPERERADDDATEDDTADVVDPVLDDPEVD